MVIMSDQVGFKLRDTADMDVILDVILEDNPAAVSARRPGGYFELDAPASIVVDLAKISARLERPFNETDFMACIASFYGRASAQDWTFRLTSDLLTVEDYGHERQ